MAETRQMDYDKFFLEFTHMVDRAKQAMPGKYSLKLKVDYSGYKTRKPDKGKYQIEVNFKTDPKAKKRGENGGQLIYVQVKNIGRTTGGRDNVVFDDIADDITEFLRSKRQKVNPHAWQLGFGGLYGYAWLPADTFSVEVMQG